MSENRLQQCLQYLLLYMLYPSCWSFAVLHFCPPYLSFITICVALCQAAMSDSKCEADVMMQVKADCLDAIMLQRRD